MMLPSALAHALARDRDELADPHLDVVLRVVAGAGRDGLEPVDVAVVVGAEEVDLLVEAAVLLAQVVRGVGGEVRRAAVGADEHAVLVVSEVGGAQPHRTALVEDVPLLAQPLDGALDRPALVEPALGEPHVEVHAEPVEGAPDRRELRLVPEVASDDERGVGVELEQVRPLRPAPRAARSATYSPG